MLAYMELISHQTSYYVEAKATHRGVMLAMEKDFFPFAIEGESKTIIDHMNGASKLRWLI